MHGTSAHTLKTSLLGLDNPWPGIASEEYERHMSHPAVLQEQALNTIFRDQYDTYLPEKLLCIGIGTGNGLEHVSQETTRIVYGIDINDDFLKTCRSRYTKKNWSLETLYLDLHREYFCEDTVDLVIANLVLEFIDIDRFTDQLKAVSRKGTIVSVVFQVRHNAPFISGSGINAIECLSGYIQEVDRSLLESRLKRDGFALIKELHHMLHDGKELVRLDFRKT